MAAAAAVRRVAVVAGATRGAGRGIAVELGRLGAVVYCTGRSVAGQPSDMGRSETLEQTARLVSEAGGLGLVHRCDHTAVDQVRALFERVRDEQGGRLDVLVNDVWGGDPLVSWGQPFWEADAAKTRLLLERAVFSHLLTARHGVPLMVARGAGLVVEVTDGDTDRYRGHLAYDLVKEAVKRAALGMAEELKPHGVVALAITPGFLRSEAMLDHFGVDESRWRDAAAVEPLFLESETPFYVDRAVAALVGDPGVASKAGRTLSSWALAEEYGFADADGRRPHWQRFYDRVEEGKRQGRPLAELVRELATP